MVYVRDGVEMKKLCVSRLSQEMQFEVSGTIVLVQKVRLVVLSVYRPCSGDFGIFLDAMSSTLDYCTSVADKIFVCGDLNVDFFNSSCPNLKLFLDLLECFNLNISSREPTSVFTDITGHTSVSKVDYILKFVCLYHRSIRSAYW